MALIEPYSYKAARALLECFCAELAANQNTDPTLKMPKHCCLRAGSEVPLDVTPDGFTATDRCCQGEAYVTVNSIYPSAVSGFPEPDTGPTAAGCQPGTLTVALQMGTIRCLNDQKSCPENELKLRLMLADAQAAYKAACCWGKQLKTVVRPGTKWFAGTWEQGGPDGGCLTGTMQLFVSVPGFGCC